ncbi:MAG: membrane protein [Candidatus Binatia bacterium]|nr:MAG: membrane protein [Candidatus Binatia bacterium]
MFAARLQLFAAAVLLSTGGAAIKASSLSSWQVAGLRSGIAAILLFALVPGARKAWGKSDVLVALPYAATLVLYVTANKLTTAANTIFLQSTAPLYVLLLSPFLLREHLDRRDVPYLLAFAVGLALFFVGRESPHETAPEPLLGNLVALSSGSTWGLTLVGLRWLARSEREGSALPAVVCGNGLAFLACLPLALPLREMAPLDALLVFYLGSVQIALSYVLMTSGFRRVSATEGTFLLLLEPVLNPVWAWWFHAERPALLACLGGVVVLTTAAAFSLRPR